MKLTLRPYQDNALERVAACEARGVRRLLGVAATGLGKTVIFSALAERTNGRTLVLAHRDELISQTAAKVLEVWSADVTITPAVHAALVGLDRRDLTRDRRIEPHTAMLGIVKAEADDVGAQVVVASVQTLARTARLERLVAAHGGFDRVIVDEAHHAEADSYQMILKTLGCNEPGGPLLLGVTATADRGDGKGLDGTFDEVAFNYDLLWGIEAGYLSDITGVQVGIAGLDVSALKVRRGDYEAGASGAALEAAGAPHHIADAWIEHAKGRHTLVFTPTVALAAAVADEFTQRGISSAWISGETPLEDRREILRSYSHGEIMVLANCAVLTEGYDEPRTDCIVMARPTKSRGFYTQCVGRGTRRHPDKVNLLVLDVVGATAQHSLVTLPSLFGLKADNRTLAEGGTVTDAVARQHDEDEAAGKLAAREAEMFRQVRREGIAWVKTTDPASRLTAYVRELGRKNATEYLPTVVLVSRHKADDRWAVGLRYPDGTSRVLMDDVPLEMAQGVGEDTVRKMATSSVLTSTKSPWRKRRPTPGQLRAAAKWRLVVNPAWTAGELSDRIDATITVRKAGRRPLLNLEPLEAS